MSVSQRFLCGFSYTFYSQSSITFFYRNLSRSRRLLLDTMPRKQSRGVHKERSWVEKSIASSSASGGSSNSAIEAVTDGLKTLAVAEKPTPSVPSTQFGSVGVTKNVPGRIGKPKTYGTLSGATGVGLDSPAADRTMVSEDGTQKESAGTSAAVLSKLLSGKLLESFTTDSSTYSLAQVRATFYPKFENEKSDQEVRTRMIEMVSNGLATLEVSLKHSGSLFMYAGHEGGAYAKNSYGNIGIVCAYRWSW